MQGFDPDFRDLPDFILKITERIWEGRSVGAGIREHYAAEGPVRSSTGVSRTAEEVVSATLQTLHEFPDRRLLGEDVVWCGDDAGGFLSSHRILSTAHHRGDGAYGRATGRSVRYRIIAECACKDNQVYEEWLVRDQGAIARCLGKTPESMAREQAAAERARFGRALFFTPEQDVPGSYQAAIEEDGPAAAYGDGLRRIWSEADLRAVRELYDPAAQLEGPGGEVVSGHDAVDALLISYLAAFPDAKLTIDHLIARADPGRPVRVAARFSIHGTHTGRGRFGAPSGAPVYIMGLSQAHVVDGRVTAEWLAIDEVAIWKQVLPASP